MTGAHTRTDRQFECNWCPGTKIHERVVMVGPAPGRPVRLMLDVTPHPDGRVVELPDGTLRMIRGRYKERPGIKQNVYRVHGLKSCGPQAGDYRRFPTNPDAP